MDVQSISTGTILYTEIWENIETKFGTTILSKDCSLGFLLLALHNQSQSCRLSIQTGMHTALLNIQKGKVIGGRNIPNAVDDLSVASIPNEALSDLVGRVMSRGHSPTEVFKAMSSGIGNYLASANRVKDAQFELQPFASPEVPVPLVGSLIALFLDGVDANLPDKKLEVRLNRMSRFQVATLNIDLSKARLSPKLIGVLRHVPEDARLADVLRTRAYSSQWRTVNHLIALGLLELKATRRNRNSSSEAEPDPKTKEMLELLSAFGDNPDLIPSYKILGLNVPGMINAKTIGEQYRSLSAQYHPDRFLSLPSQNRNRAQQIFSRIASAYQELENEDLWDTLKDRLDAESRGEKYVTDHDRQEADMLYAQAKHSFRRKSFTDAEKYVTQGLEADPYNWRLQYLSIQLDVQLKGANKAEAAEKLVRLEGPRAHEKVEVLYLAGEYFLQAGEKDQAFSLFDMVVEKSPEHIGARRHLRLKNLRSKVASETQSQKKGFWSGLLSGKGKK